MQTSQILSHRLPHVFLGSRDGVAVRVLASHFCGLASIPEPNVTCELSVSLILVFDSRFFSPGPSVLLPPEKSTFQISIQPQWKRRTIRAT